MSTEHDDDLDLDHVHALDHATMSAAAPKPKRRSPGGGAQRSEPGKPGAGSDESDRSKNVVPVERPPEQHDVRARIVGHSNTAQTTTDVLIGMGEKHGIHLGMSAIVEGTRFRVTLTKVNEATTQATVHANYLEVLASSKHVIFNPSKSK